MKRVHVKVHTPPLLPQDWKEQYIHENYSRALEGEGLVEQVSPMQDPRLPRRPPPRVHCAALMGASQTDCPRADRGKGQADRPSAPHPANHQSDSFLSVGPVGVMGEVTVL